MKYLDFTKSYMIEDSNFGYIISENGEAVSVPFEVFFKGIIMVDDRWGKSIKLLTDLMEIRDRVKELSYNDSKENKFLELSDDQWQMCVEISSNPQAGYNVNYCTALFAHVNDLKKATSIKPDLA